MNTENPQEVERGNAVVRTVHFSDAVVAIAITLFTLELRLPEALAAGEVPGHLLDALSGLFAFLISFQVIAYYWVAPPPSRSLTSWWRLAFSLHAELTKRNKEIPGIIDNWRLEARTDPLPEVRRTWKAQ